MDRLTVATKHNRPIRIGPLQIGLRVGFQLDDSLGSRAGDNAGALHTLSSSDLALASNGVDLDLLQIDWDAFGWLNWVTFLHRKLP